MFGIFKKKLARKTHIQRPTKETKINCRLNIDGSGKTDIKTGIGFLDHMLELFAFHGKFNLSLRAQGDIERIDIHHTNEDVGIVLGQAFRKALGDMKGINRFGYASVPMEDVVANVTVDISGRGHFRLHTNEAFSTPELKDQDGYAFIYAEHLLESFSKHLGVNLNINVDFLSPDLHTNLEPVFKALGIALVKATQIDLRTNGIPSTK